MEGMEVRVNIMAALGERLHKQSLEEWLIDNAEDVIEQSRPGFHEEEVESTTVCVDGEDFLVRFSMPNDKAQLRSEAR
jgi:hypothetical protein